MSKINDRELELLEMDDIGPSIERIKRKGKFVRQDKHPDKRKPKRQNQDWIYELDKEDTDEDFS